jgi:phage-related minor tail protein
MAVSKVEFDVLANDKASAKLDKIANTFLNVGRAASKVGDVGGKSMGKLTQGAGFAIKGLTKLPALAAGTAVGALFVSGLTSAMDIQEANHLLAAQLGFTGPESAKAGKIAGDLYKNAYGDSVSEVNGVLKEVFQNGLATVNDSADAIKGVTTQVMNFAKIAGEEALPVTRAVSQMLKTGLAKNATEAFDILTRGQQLGVNKSQDLLDTFNEYGTQFRKIGLDGPTALGLMSQAIKGGARDSDLAADSLKEFSIRAIDGSATTVDAFKSLGLSAKGMQEQIAGGGPKAAAGLGMVLDKLRGIKDPAEQSRIAVELFGTQAEDMGKALFKMDTKTAVAGLGKLKGAAADAGDTLNDTAKGKFTAAMRTIQMSVVDGIGKYVLPTFERFAEWFNGPGKFTMISWAIEGGSAILDLSDKMLGGLQAMMGGLSKYAKIALIAAAGTIAIANPTQAFNLLKQADAVGKWASEAETGIAGARKELKGWKDGLDKTNTKVKFQANIADLEAKVAKAQKELKDPNLTKVRQAQLKANIADLTEKIRLAKGGLSQPQLVATKIAKFQADKTDLDRKIAAAQFELKAPSLTATRRAHLQAEIGQLLAAKKRAQDSINSLQGKTVKVVLDTYKNMIQTTIVGGIGVKLPGHAKGGPVKRGQPYVVGEEGPEVFVSNESGSIIPNGATAGGRGAMGGGAPVVLRIDSSGSRLDDLLVELLQKAVRNRGGNVQLVLGRNS